MSSPVNVLSIGVYGFTGDSFLQQLRRAGVGIVLDVRQRRGVRGPSYTWANAIRLQASLADAGISYRHLRSLAPTTELRHLQYAADARGGVGQRSRRALDEAYITRYTREILGSSDVTEVIDAAAQHGTAALLCLETDPEACHRSLIGSQLEQLHGITVQHLRPPDPS